VRTPLRRGRHPPPPRHGRAVMDDALLDLVGESYLRRLDTLMQVSSIRLLETAADALMLVAIRRGLTVKQVVDAFGEREIEPPSRVVELVKRRMTERGLIG